ncbi:MAG: polyketide cyclase [Planctomycetaceae bacterium]|nr:polyketide cyclase [Planctomycetaceae bacterium]
MLKKIALGFVALLAAFAAFVSMQPAEFQVVRSTGVAAPAAVVFSQVNDFHNWEEWSPWAKLDPTAKNTFEGPTAGTGSIFKWSGNDEVGEGIMTVLESHPNDLIRINLEFVRPFADTSITEFTFVPNGEKTVVTWSMSGRKNFISKAVCLFMNMDKTVGGDFEKGLAKMKAIAEGAAKKEAASGAEEGESAEG